MSIHSDPHPLRLFDAVEPGVRVGLVKNQQVTSVGRVRIGSASELANAVMRLTKSITPSAVAVPGTLSGDKVKLSRNAGWLIGDTPAIIGNALGVGKDRIRIVHDGEAHVLACHAIPCGYGRSYWFLSAKLPHPIGDSVSSTE